MQRLLFLQINIGEKKREREGGGGRRARIKIIKREFNSIKLEKDIRSFPRRDSETIARNTGERHNFSETSFVIVW